MVARGALLVLLALAIASGCSGSDPKTADELRGSIAAYEQATPDASEDRIKSLFARLDAEVAAVRADELAKPPGARDALTQRREALEAERRDLQMAYLKARVARLGAAAQDALKSVGQQLGQELEDAGRKLRESSEGTNPPATP
ncbi:MAG TPA: hypothetical protein VMS22_16700 [Candidatus Eisenbacteria bacterium]|nr:hypothetical protein [Candidatus Eisenbacteria bacterium]